jgi:hypothetical protein
MDYPRAFVSFPRIAGSGNEIELGSELIELGSNRSVRMSDKDKKDKEDKKIKIRR